MATQISTTVVLPLKIQVSITDAGCWEPEGLNQNSTGYVSLGSQSLHRLSFESHHSPLLPGEIVRHACDNRLCFNPDHLLRGTRADNTRDMLQRGRGGTQRLTEDDVRSIRARYVKGCQGDNRTGNVRKLAEEYGITVNAVRDAARGRTFSWVK